MRLIKNAEKFAILFFSFALIFGSVASAKVSVVDSESQPFSAYPDYASISGQMQKYFWRCNPCTAYIIVSGESQFFETFTLNINPITSNCDVNTKIYGCVEITQSNVYTFQHYGNSQFCKNADWRDVTQYGNTWCSQSYWCWKQDGQDCIGSKLKCEKYDCGSTNWISANIDGKEVYRYENGSIVHNDELALIVDQKCSQEILACQKTGQCGAECKITVAFHSQSKYGSFDMQNPSFSYFVPATTTTTGGVIGGGGNIQTPKPDYTVGLIIIGLVIIVSVGLFIKYKYFS